MNTEPKIGTYTQTPGYLAGVQSVRYNKITVREVGDTYVSILAMSEDGKSEYRGWETRQEWTKFCDRFDRKFVGE